VLNTAVCDFNIIWNVHSVKYTNIFINKLYARINEKALTRFGLISGHLLEV
jgi:hypothetical protein